MDSRSTFWVATLCAGTLFWFYLNLTLEIDYTRHTQLVDPLTGKKSKPSDLLDLSKIINYTDSYIESTNSQERLYDLQYLMKFENPFLNDNSYSSKKDQLISGWPVANNSLCGQQLNWILNQLEQHKDYTFLKGKLGFELTRFMDSFGRPETGTYSGVVDWMGSYKSCSLASLNNGQIKTRYCYGRMKPKWWPQNETTYLNTNIRIGMCLPETCDTNSFDHFASMIEKLVKFELPEIYKDGLELKSIFCLPDERSPIRQIPQSGRAYLSILLAWFILIITASLFYEIRTRKQRKNSLTVMRCEINGLKQVECTLSKAETNKNILDKILSALSIRCSIKSFKQNIFKVNYNKGERVRVHLGCLDFFKIWMAIVVVLGHSAYLSSSSTRSLTNRVEINTSTLGRMALSVSRCVDTFFLFFGLLSSYTLMRKFNTKRLSNPLTWILVNFGVFCRITPIFMLVYWYSKSVAPFTGSGPWWDYGVDKFSARGICMSDAWWKSIPYFGSLGTPAIPACNLPSWFIVSYSQISLLLPIITYLICVLPRFFMKFIFVFFFSLTSALIIGTRLFLQTSIKEEGFTLYGGFLSDLLEKFESTGHLSTLGRVGSVVVGCLTGYLLRLYEEKQISNWPSWLVSKSTCFLTFIAHLIIVFLPFLGHISYLYTGRLISLKEFVGSNIALIIIWPILNAIFIINITSAYNHTVLIRFLSHSFWHIFNRLGLCIYLVHWEVLLIGIASYEQAPSYGFLTDVFKLWSFGLYLSIIIAFLIHILIETPLSKLLALSMQTFMRINRENNNTCENNKIDPA